MLLLLQRQCPKTGFSETEKEILMFPKKKLRMDLSSKAILTVSASLTVLRDFLEDPVATWSHVNVKQTDYGNGNFRAEFALEGKIAGRRDIDKCIVTLLVFKETLQYRVVQADIDIYTDGETRVALRHRHYGGRNAAELPPIAAIPHGDTDTVF